MRFFIFLIACCSATAQPVPQIFEQGLISNDGIFGLAISPDSKTALFVLSNGKRDTLVIKQSEKISGKWSEPKTASFSNDKGKWKDIDPVYSPDGKTVYFQSTRPVPGKPERKGFDLWAVTRKRNGWGKPFHLGNVINSDASESYASATRSGDLYFMKENPDGIGSSDIYLSKYVNGEYLAPQNIGLPINTPERESNPFISSDGDFIIYFSVKEHNSTDIDLFISFNRDGTWSAPVNLGSDVNSELSEFCPFYHENEKRLYFARQKKEGDRMIENAYSVDFDPEKYRK